MKYYSVLKMDEILLFVTERPTEQYVKPHKPGREEQIAHGLTYVCYPERLSSQKQKGEQWLKRWERGGVGRWL